MFRGFDSNNTRVYGRGWEALRYRQVNWQVIWIVLWFIAEHLIRDCGQTRPRSKLGCFVVPRLSLE